MRKKKGGQREPMKGEGGGEGGEAKEKRNNKENGYRK